MDKKIRRPYLKHKMRLFFDENIPVSLVNRLKTNNFWKEKCRLISSSDQNFEGRDDNFIFNYCKNNFHSIVTLDKGFMNDRKYPFGKMPGIILVVAKKNEVNKIENVLTFLLQFLSTVYLPRIFLGDTKIQASENYALFKGKDYISGKIKSIKIGQKDALADVLIKFSYPPFVPKANF